MLNRTYLDVPREDGDGDGYLTSGVGYAHHPRTPGIPRSARSTGGCRSTRSRPRARWRSTPATSPSRCRTSRRPSTTTSGTPWVGRTPPSTSRATPGNSRTRSRRSISTPRSESSRGREGASCSPRPDALDVQEHPTARPAFLGDVVSRAGAVNIDSFRPDPRCATYEGDRSLADPRRDRGGLRSESPPTV